MKVLKDLNFTENSEKMQIGSAEKARVMEVIKRDTEFLASMGLMDYSLLLIKSAKRG